MPFAIRLLQFDLEDISAKDHRPPLKWSRGYLAKSERREAKSGYKKPGAS